MLDNFLWNETAQYYNAYSTADEFIYENFVSESGVELCDYGQYDVPADSEHVLRRRRKSLPCLEGRPTSPGAVMADTFYAQVNERSDSVLSWEGLASPPDLPQLFRRLHPFFCTASDEKLG